MHSNDKDTQLIWERYITENESGRYAGSFNRQRMEGEHALHQAQAAEKEREAVERHAMGEGPAPGFEQAEESEGFTLDAIIAHGAGAIPGGMAPEEYFKFMKEYYKDKLSPAFFQKLDQAEAQLASGE